VRWTTGAVRSYSAADARASPARSADSSWLSRQGCQHKTDGAGPLDRLVLPLEIQHPVHRLGAAGQVHVQRGPRPPRPDPTPAGQPRRRPAPGRPLPAHRRWAATRRAPGSPHAPPPPAPRTPPRPARPWPDCRRQRRRRRSERREPARLEDSTANRLMFEGMSLSVVPEGSGSKLIEFGEFLTSERTLKADIGTPITAQVQPRWRTCAPSAKHAPIRTSASAAQCSGRCSITARCSLATSRRPCRRSSIEGSCTIAVCAIPAKSCWWPWGRRRCC
jgi:hypothetical protein